MKYLLDNCISHRYADMISALGIECVALRHEYPQDIKDPPLLRELKKQKNLVFISNDTSQLTRETEARLLKAAKVTAIYFEPFWGKLTFWNQAIWLVKHWQGIEKFADSTVLGTCGRMKQGGRIDVFNV